MVRKDLPGWFLALEESGLASVEHSTRARRTRVCFDDLGVRLVVPSRGRQSVPVQFLEANRAWVERHADRARARLAELATWEGCAMEEGSRVPFDGNLRGLRRAAAGALAALLEEEAERTGLTPSKVAIREMRTRWGSCSSSRRVCLNWRLAMAPETVRRYVVVHELAHLEVLNHSPRFWGVVQRWMPEWREGRAWLRDRGWLLANLPRC